MIDYVLNIHPFKLYSLIGIVFALAFVKLLDAVCEHYIMDPKDEHYTEFREFKILWQAKGYLGLFLIYVMLGLFWFPIVGYVILRMLYELCDYIVYLQENFIPIVTTIRKNFAYANKLRKRKKVIFSRKHSKTRRRVRK